MPFADIAVNLGDAMFEGSYHGRQKHVSDLQEVVARARERGVERMLLTGTSLEESAAVLKMAERFGLHCTVGIHPTSTSSVPSDPVEADKHFDRLEELLRDDASRPIEDRRVRALGEVGLDYDRLKFSSKETQLQYLPRLLQLGKKHRLPFFLHSRTSESHSDLVRTLIEAGWPRDGVVGRDQDWVGGVVHSFTGTREEAAELVDLGLYIGINGCSLKTEDNLEVVRTIPLDRLLLETDAPWCSITNSHASRRYLPSTDSLFIPRVNKPEKFAPGLGVKGRQEPADVVIIAHVVAAIRGESVAELTAAVWCNSCSLFWPESTVTD